MGKAKFDCSNTTQKVFFVAMALQKNAKNKNIIKFNKFKKIFSNNFMLDSAICKEQKKILFFVKNYVKALKGKLNVANSAVAISTIMEIM